ncbi:MAG: sodium-dependent transporter [Legionellales bacterium]|nr:sodium-dependent transporter [Legionellales bacterium]|tara:strand:+ start:3903 stop:5267 length:1365 start_codon:yes stop_codon:yes gene_type:complete
MNHGIEQRQSQHGQWSSRWAFIMAATGAAVGLGNIWKFPYITGQHGGGAFVLIYLVCIFIIGIPVMMAEIMIGRSGRQNPLDSMKSVAVENGRSSHWRWVGALGILASFLILSYYSVIAGWSLAYVFKVAVPSFIERSPQAIDASFDNFVANPWKLLFWHSVMIIATAVIIAKGVEKGIEKTVYVMFPAMLTLLGVLVVYAMESGHFAQSVSYLFHPDFSKLKTHGIVAAMGQAFFSLSLATGSIMMYGAYLPRSASVTKAAVVIALSDTFVALLAGLAIFPVVFANGLEPSSGPGLIFETLPIAFGHMPFGNVFATLFFVMLVFAAFTSAISLLEPSVAWLIETFKIPRRKAAIISSFGIWFVGLVTVVSFNWAANIKLFKLTMFEVLDFLTANIMLPLGGFFIAIFAVWFLNRDVARRELQLPDGKLFSTWRFVVRYISPVAILVVFISVIV